MTSKTTFINRLFIFGVILTFFSLASEDLDIQRENHDEYCQMTHEYKLSNGEAGWPAYNEANHCPK